MFLSILILQEYNRMNSVETFVESESPKRKSQHYLLFVSNITVMQIIIIVTNQYHFLIAIVNIKLTLHLTVLIETPTYLHACEMYSIHKLDNAKKYMSMYK